MTVTHLPDRSRFVIHTQDGDALLTYHRSAGVIDLLHTEVPPEAQGQGLGDKLTQAAFDFARDEGLKVIPSCPFVQHWLTEHPDAQALV